MNEEANKTQKTYYYKTSVTFPKFSKVLATVKYIPKYEKAFVKNMSLKLDVVSLIISDEDINFIKSKFNDRPSILYTMRLLLTGESMDYAIETASKIMKRI